MSSNAGAGDGNPKSEDPQSTSSGDDARPEADRREFERVDFAIEVSFESESATYQGVTENISAGGLFVATSDVRDLGSVISVELTLPGREEPIQARGEVRWTREIHPLQPDAVPGMGIQFLDLLDEAAAEIHRFTKKKEPL